MSDAERSIPEQLWRIASALERANDLAEYALTETMLDSEEDMGDFDDVIIARNGELARRLWAEGGAQ